MPAIEANFDGLIGPTHNYAGLSPGNPHSEHNAGRVSNPRGAVLQGLAKARMLAERGLAQALIPPPERPRLDVLRQLGFTGDDAAVLDRARRDAPSILAACWSASSMWAANAATVSPSSDTTDGRVHLTPANLMRNLHRAIEAPETTHALRTIFANDTHFAVHDPLPHVERFADEGAANHMRLAPEHGNPGLAIFVNGFDPQKLGDPAPRRYRPRQSADACRAIARAHGLHPERVLHLRQTPEAIDTGVFHNDVIATANARVLLAHETAFTERDPTARITTAAERAGVGDIAVHIARAADFPLTEAVSSYIFNSQLITMPNGDMVLVAPNETRDAPRVRSWVESLTAGEGPLAEVIYADVRESMRNGGGPACLRLRVVLTEAERAAVHPGVWLTSELHDRLVDWATRRYRESLSPSELADPALITETRDALDELTTILGLPAGFYPFQR